MREAFRQTVAFLASGGLAFATDAGVLVALTRGLNLDPYSARIIAIGCAMIVGFFAHRHLTFRVKTRATWREFAKFLSVAATASLVNYGIYAGLLLLRPSLDPLYALLIATAFAMSVSYIGYRFGVFRQPEL